MAKVDVAVLGAGLVGSALGFHLKQRGVGGVLLYDPGAPGGGASGRSAGILSAQGWDPWDLSLVLETADEYRSISERMGLGSYHENGGLRVVRTPEGERWLRRSADLIRKAGAPAELLPSEALASLLPAGALGDVRVGLRTPRDATVSAEELTLAYVRLASKLGALVRVEGGPSKVARTSRGWEVETSAGGFEAAKLVLACGAWTKQILEDLGTPLPLSPFRTQACVLRPRPLSGPFPSFHDTDLGFYVRPWGAGRLLVGDGTENVETDPRSASPKADFPFLDSVGQRVSDVLPGWAPHHVEKGWAGVCVASPDRYPLVGSVPGSEGLFVATGFNGFGLMKAAAIARRLADGIALDRWDGLAPAIPARFRGKELHFVPRPEFSLLPPTPGEASPERTVVGR